jgi:hypothetical protein
MLSIPIVSQFNDKGIKNAIKGFKQLETTGQKASFLLKAGMAAGAAGIAAVGAAALTAGKMLWEFAQMARADQLAQVQLAGTLKQTTKATDAQIASVEKWIDATQRLTGVADDELRPSLARLSRSTKDIGKAQKLLNLALDISGRTGKPLATVVNALGKAYDGSNTALAKLGLGYSKAELKAKSFAQVQDDLTKQYEGGALEKANTFEGTMARLKITFDELKESLGTQLLPMLQKLAESAISIADAFGKGGFSGAVEELRFQLQYLLYDQNGNLNAAGKQLNSLIKIFDAFATVSNATRFTPSSIIGNKLLRGEAIPDAIGKIDTFSSTIDIKARDQRTNLANIERGLGNQAYVNQNTVNINVASGTDPAKVGREVQKNLDALDRRGR